MRSSIILVCVAALAVLLDVFALSLQAAPPLPTPEPGMSISEGGAEIHWTRPELPLRVIVHPSAKSWKLAFHEAVAFWNDKLGFTMFTISADFHPEATAYLEYSPGVLPVLGVECYAWRFCPNPMTWQMHNKKTGEMSSAPIFVPVFDGDQLIINRMRWAAIHELGHALGLEHDPQTMSSIMVPDPFTGNKEMPPITAADLATLRRFYGPNAQ